MQYANNHEKYTICKDCKHLNLSILFDNVVTCVYHNLTKIVPLALVATQQYAQHKQKKCNI